ncbi:MAG TPA: hypothetical protein VGC34_14510, partial [Steroidobacteraceae bacterium]
MSTYSWKQTSGPSVALSGASTSVASFVAPNVASAAPLGFSLTLGDSTGATATSTATINITPASAARTTAKFVTLQFLQPANGNFHTDSIAVDGPPLAGSNTSVQVTLAGFVQSPSFTLTDATGASLGTPMLSLSGNSAAQPLDFAGAITIPSVPFYVVAQGTTADGQPYSLHSP